MARWNRSGRRWRLTLIWVALLSLLVQTSAGAQDDDCERMTSSGTTRDCTFLEEIRECVDDANDSYDDCMDDAFNQDGFITIAVNVAGCELASFVNLTACATGGIADWHLGGAL